MNAQRVSQRHFIRHNTKSKSPSGLEPDFNGRFQLSAPWRKASQLAAREIEGMSDKSLPAAEQQRRKRRLTHGPREFRDIRGDQPKTKS